MSSQHPPPYGTPPPGYGPPPVYTPPGQGYTPPPGYGPPPPYNSNMPPPPQKRGMSTGAMVGIGCAAAGLLALLAVGGLLIGSSLLVKSAVHQGASGAAEEPSAAAAIPKPPTGAPKAELRDLRTWKNEVGFRHFVGEIANVGTEPIGFPRAKVTLLDAAGVAVDSGVCLSAIHALDPGSKIPCTFLLTSKVEFTQWKADVTGLPVAMPEKTADLAATDIKFTPKKGYAPATLEGKITNKSPFRAKHVQAIVSLYGTDGKIVAAHTALVAGNDLEPGGAGLFSAKIYDMAATPDTYRVRAVGYE